MITVWHKLSRKTTGLAWLGLSIFVVVAFSLLLPIQPNDYWWYVRLGQEIAQRLTIPTVDTFTYKQAGQPIVYHSWLAALFFWGIHEVGGLSLTVLVRGLLLGLFYAFTWQTCRFASGKPLLASLLTVMIALIGSQNWAVRPQLFSLPCFSLSLLLLWRWQQGRQANYLWLLPVIMLLWVNLHGAFILGVLLIGAAFIGSGDRRSVLLGIMGLLVLASLLNPRQIGAWTYVYTLLTDPPSQQLGAEWAPPTNEGWQGILFFCWFLLLIPLAARSPARLTTTQWLWLLGFGWLALSGLRYVVWFLAVLAPITAQWLKPILGTRLAGPRRTYFSLDLAFVIILLSLALALLPRAREQWWSSAPPVLSRNTPIEATAWLRTQSTLPGPLWADLAFSAYLIYALPERPVWIDTRFELFPLSHWEDYQVISNAKPGWQTLLKRDKITLLMLDSNSQLSLITALQEAPEWQAIYQDQRAVIFERGNE